MARRTPEELAAHHDAEAKKHALRARIAKDPTLGRVIALRDELMALLLATEADDSLRAPCSASVDALSKLAEAM